MPKKKKKPVHKTKAKIHKTPKHHSKKPAKAKVFAVSKKKTGKKTEKSKEELTTVKVLPNENEIAVLLSIG